ncbi:hypothetical protein Mal52_27340 [Symmachiella dynata]|uniref:DUF1559 domain-containing protein n=1 Tax=Symmachiella dynata TaxID=2527995 RepID=A0A517ZP46_9PLAN|nr:DUF1559 domain-containing protein [Symmachiella dynata]QDU44255.1 hypothetical protein Mal52_27340 [Symmachiella dynata]
MRKYVILACAIVAVGVFALYKLDEMRKWAQGPLPRTKMKMIALAMHNYAEAHGSWPTDLLDDNGRVLLSWRVRMCEYLDGQPTIDVTLPWDATENEEAAKAIPRSFRNDDFIDGMYPYGCRTQILGVFSSDGVWNGEAKGNVLFVDGQPVQCVWAGPPYAVLWTQPLDLSVDDAKRLLERDEYASNPEDRRIQHVSLQDGRVTSAPFEWEVRFSSGNGETESE